LTPNYRTLSLTLYISIDEVELMQANGDLMVLVDVAPPAAAERKDHDGPRLSTWQDILPQQAPGIELAAHLIVVHANPHPGQSSIVGTHSRATVKARANHSHSAPADGGVFCGWDKRVSMIRLEVSPQYLRRAEANLSFERLQSPTLRVFHGRDPRVLKMGEWLMDERQIGSQDGGLFLDSLANTLALHVLRNYTAQTAMPDIMQLSQHVSPEVGRAIEFMHANLSGSISLAELAQAAHVSPSQLTRLFKRSTGLAPHQFLIRLRVDRAREILQSGTLSISEVAALSGFADQSHLHRHVKRVYGIPPKALLPRE
jgi:AraC family transcriptional regulator